MSEIPARTMQDIWEEFSYAREVFDDALFDLIQPGEEYGGLRHDPYDLSIEIDSATSGLRLHEAAQRFIHESGFRKAYINHKDGVQTHYTWGPVFAPDRGWRRKNKPGGGWLISYRPPAWFTKTCDEWFRTGYAEVDQTLDAAGVNLPPQPDEAREGSQSPDDGRDPGLTPNPSFSKAEGRTP